MTDEKKPIGESIDEDAGLKSKGRTLILYSVVLIALVYTGAMVEEANSVIFKLKFTHQAGIPHLLLLAIAWSAIRYYSYAKPYHDELFRLWSSRMLEDHFFYGHCDESDTVNGLIYDIAPESVPDPIEFHRENPDHNISRRSYYCSPILSRSFRYDWFDGHYPSGDKLRIPLLTDQYGWRTYPKIYAYEMKYQVKGLIDNRENLDIYAPYLFGGLSVTLYIFKEELAWVLTTFFS